MTTWLAIITCIATAVNAIAVVYLVRVTTAYAASSQRQAAAAELQAKAATAQANAAQAQAHAASSTLASIREQMYNQSLMARKVVEGTIKSALANIDHWQQITKEGFGLAVQTKSLPTTIILTPANHSQALDSARQISPRIADALREAFDSLNAATQKIEALKGFDMRMQAYFDPTKETREINSLLTRARETMQKCQTDVYTVAPDDDVRIVHIPPSI